MKFITIEHQFQIKPELASCIRESQMCKYPSLVQYYVWKVTNIAGLIPFICLLNRDTLGCNEAEVDYLRLIPYEQDNANFDKYAIQISWYIDADMDKDDFISGITQYLKSYPAMLSPNIVTIY